MSSRDTLYNIAPRAHNMVLCTSKFVKQVDFMLSVLIPKSKETKDTRTFGEVLYMSITLW